MVQPLENMLKKTVGTATKKHEEMSLMNKKFTLDIFLL